MGEHEHPSYNPDLEPGDYDISEPLNKHLAAKRSGENANV